MDTVVQTAYGKVEGLRERGTYVFKGLPFAAPPVGARRWLPPARPERWEGVRPATAFSPACPQESLTVSAADIFAVQGPQDEDCLYLNIWSPGVDDAARPVMVWIHGGGYNMGSASQPIFDGVRLASRGDVVVVTINYRLGPLGFMNLTEVTGGAIPSTGNEGLLDMVAALEWIQENIAAFGGNPDNVTVFGESAGGWAAGALLAMPRAAGLFHKAIAQSGVGHPGLDLEHAHHLAGLFADRFGATARDADQLRAAPPEKILAAAPSLFKSFFEPDPANSDRYLRHVVDGDILPMPIVDAVAAGSSAGIPLMVGTTRDEVAKIFVVSAFTEGEPPFDKVRRLVHRDVDVRQLASVYAQARRDRFARDGDGDVAAAIATDTVRIPSLRLLDAHRRHQSSTYGYLFSWTSPGGDAAYGSPHGIDIGFLFGTYDLADDYAAEWGQGPAAAALSQAVMDAWTAFARTGDPSSPTLGAWPEYGDARRTMVIGERTHVIDAPYDEERRAWEPYSNADLARPLFRLPSREDAAV
ncbi:carboxylesterase [Nocardia nova SH22a]|uniref:Carboxylic ester hydrolase n=1 Tax=Nocardia nova SH22a TaxID=1415166 RepID=W5TRJ0_9NOCA|nr:carboxylesterase/lipase family protein [Nocardia nova]AHH19846.1 carboxylesterase [Nocardia nova SH22a]